MSNDALTCPACRTLTHEGCQLEASGVCPTLGCVHAARRKRPPARRRLLSGGFAGWWLNNRLLVVANAVVWTLVGLVGGVFVLGTAALLLADA